MSDDQDLDALAGEFVLGTLTPEERASVGRRRIRERALDQAIRAWERRLGPLAETGREVAVPAADALFADIEAKLGVQAGPAAIAKPQPPAATAEIIVLQRRVRRWQMGSLLSGAIAASLATVIWLRPPLQAPQQPTNFVAVLQKDAASPGFLVSVDISTRQMTVRQVAADKLSGKSYELWLINDRFPAPKSLGVVKDSGFSRGVTLASYSPEVVETSLYAVTLEPEGGSPTGGPTGPVVFKGTLVQATP